MNLADKLLAVRKAANISRSQLVELLKQRGFDVKSYTVCKWETGASKPTVEAFLAICEICRVRDIQLAFSGRKRLLRLFDIPVSAGQGSYLEGSGYEMIEVDSLVPASADYAVRVSGDSMMPRFVDQQIIFIHEQPVLDDGEIGIFFLSGDAYLKKLQSGNLVSLNPAYEPIPIRGCDDFRVYGKVVG